MAHRIIPTPTVLPANPFTDQYVYDELAWYGVPPSTTVGHVEVGILPPHTLRLDADLNSNVRVATPPIPALWIDGQVWMSLTPMEVQSAALAIALARGQMATAGLGLGYFALRCAARSEVEAVDVYEMNPDVIRWFVDTFQHRAEFAKITIIEGDVRMLLRGKHYDYVWMDVYQQLLGRDALADAQLFVHDVNNTIGQYRFWGEERIVLDALMACEVRHLTPYEQEYFGYWIATPVDGPHASDTFYRDLYVPLTSAAFRRDAFRIMGRRWEEQEAA